MNPPQNEMMNRPIVQENVLKWMRESQKQFTGHIKTMQEYAKRNNMPIIPHETAVFLDFIIHLLNPKNILEVGTAIGFSASVMANASNKNCKIETIDRFGLMIKQARENFEKQNFQNKITLLEGQAEDILPKLCETQKQTKDIIFLDCAKSKYIEFLPYCSELLTENGVIIIDDIFQAGTIFDDESEVRHKRRKIYEGLNKLLREANNNEKYISTTLPLGDGLLLIQKNQKHKEM